MSAAPQPSIDELIGRLQATDDSARKNARAELITRSYECMVQCARRMLRDFPGVRRREQTDDVSNEAARRLWQAMDRETFIPVSSATYFSQAACEIRRVLIDLARKYAAANGHEVCPSNPGGADSSGQPPSPLEPMNTTYDPARLARWTRFHELVAALPEPERAVTDQLYYHGLTQEEAAMVLGVSVRTVRSRWQSARWKLHEGLGSSPSA